MATSPSKAQNAISQVVGVLLVLGFFVLLGYSQRQQRQHDAEIARKEAIQQTAPVRAQFQPLLNAIQWPDQAFTAATPLVEVGPREFARGVAASGFKPPCVVLDLDERDIWRPWCDWPRDIKAESLREVQTVVFVAAVNTRVTTYTSGHPGFRRDYKVWVFDWERKRVVDSAVLLGGELPESIPGGKFDFSGVPVVGPPPDLLHWLTH